MGGDDEHSCRAHHQHAVRSVELFSGATVRESLYWSLHIGCHLQALPRGAGAALTASSTVGVANTGSRLIRVAKQAAGHLAGGAKAHPRVARAGLEVLAGVGGVAVESSLRDTRETSLGATLLESDREECVAECRGGSASGTDSSHLYLRGCWRACAGRRKCHRSQIPLQWGGASLCAERSFRSNRLARRSRDRFDQTHSGHSRFHRARHCEIGDEKRGGWWHESSARNGFYGRGFCEFSHTNDPHSQIDLQPTIDLLTQYQQAFGVTQALMDAFTATLKSLQKGEFQGLSHASLESSARGDGLFGLSVCPKAGRCRGP